MAKEFYVKETHFDGRDVYDWSMTAGPFSKKEKDQLVEALLGAGYEKYVDGADDDDEDNVDDNMVERMDEECYYLRLPEPMYDHHGGHTHYVDIWRRKKSGATISDVINGLPRLDTWDRYDDDEEL